MQIYKHESIKVKPFFKKLKFKVKIQKFKFKVPTNTF